MPESARVVTRPATAPQAPAPATAPTPPVAPAGATGTTAPAAPSAAVASPASVASPPAAAGATGWAVTTRWLWLVVAAGIAFVVIGTAMYWSVVSRQNPFESGIGSENPVVEQILTTLAPALVQVGVLAVVGALLAWAIIGTSTGRRGRP
jgi:hypothetical protein